MINALGVVGWGVGGIEAEAGMLGQPLVFLTPDVVGVHLHGRLREGATIANMAPEYGATMGFFPVDEATVRYLEATGRTEAEIGAFRAYFTAQGLFGIPMPGDIDYSEVIEFDLGSVQPSIAGPKRPQDRLNLPDMGRAFVSLFSASAEDDGYGRPATELERQPTGWACRRPWAAWP
ncbi:aconitase family protein [Magnetospirillum moscoviense]|uniref:aconitate hydratase n=1 Tax=Magnetospirillum moscoviense TaxID=1437059 RepID=A0A178MSW0_9PROT|nr:hypothetical protein A6A05_11365 [Magnetospirillum moscoviense]